MFFVKNNLKLVVFQKKCSKITNSYLLKVISNNLKPAGVTRRQLPFRGRRTPNFELMTKNGTEDPYLLLGRQLCGVRIVPEEEEEEDEGEGEGEGALIEE